MSTLFALALAVAAGALVYSITLHKQLQEQHDRTRRDIAELTDMINDANARTRQMAGSIDKLNTRLEDVEKGLVPDTEKAKQAAQSINDFNSAVASIFGHDPFKKKNPVEEVTD